MCVVFVVNCVAQLRERYDDTEKRYYYIFSNADPPLYIYTFISLYVFFIIIFVYTKLQSSLLHSESFILNLRLVFAIKFMLCMCVCVCCLAYAMFIIGC